MLSSQHLQSFLKEVRMTLVFRILLNNNTTSLTSAYCTTCGMSDVFVRLTPIQTDIAKKILRYDALYMKTDGYST
jgi:hypothetical protein